MKQQQQKIKRSETQSSSSSSAPSTSSSTTSGSSTVTTAPFCIIEDGSNVGNFDDLSTVELKQNIENRRNEIFRLMEEVRRLRVQEKQRVTPRSNGNNRTIMMSSGSSVGVGVGNESGDDLSDLLSFQSAIPLFPDLKSTDKLDEYYRIFGALIFGLILFGGIIAPTLEIYLGLDGKSYTQVIESLHLPSVLARVDPIVASFTGGAVGVLTALLLVEVNNVEKVTNERCLYCSGTGYLPCGECGGQGFCNGSCSNDDSNKNNLGCGQCSSSGRVMCPSCLCTGMALATEHDPRIDPFTLDRDPRREEELSPFLTGTIAKDASKTASK